MLIKELILFCYIFKNIYIFAEIKNKKLCIKFTFSEAWIGSVSHATHCTMLTVPSLTLQVTMDGTTSMIKMALLMLMPDKITTSISMHSSFKSSKIMDKNRKAWTLEVSCTELTILQIALQRFMQKYDGEIFTAEEIKSTHDELWTYKYISQL